MSHGTGHALSIERSCAVMASALSEGRCEQVRLMSGGRRTFSMNTARTALNVPYPALAPDWTLQTLACGIALQCSPSKQRIAKYALGALTARQAAALSIVEGGVALGWIASRWPGFIPEIRRLLPDLAMRDGELDGRAILEGAMAIARSKQELRGHPLLGQLPIGVPAELRTSFTSCSLLASHALTLGAIRCPSSVSMTPRPVRSNRRPPHSCSS